MASTAVRRGMSGWLAVFAVASLLRGPAATADGPAAAHPPTHAVGLASVDITPPYPVRLNGFGSRTRESQGTRLPIHARAIAIGPLAGEGTAEGSVDPREANAATVVVIAVETLGIPGDVTERLAARLASRGITRDHLAICATHTHSAPMVRGCANTLFGADIAPAEWGRILAHTADLEARLEEAALAALADRTPAALSRATGSLGFAFNRRTPGGPVDHDLPLLVVRAPDGTLRGLFTTYACHCVTLSDDLVSGDWAGYAVRHLERRHPGCTALLSIGCGADSNPRGGVLGADERAADVLGREYADEVDRLLAGECLPVTGAPEGSLERVSLPLAPLPDRAAWERRAREPGAVGHHARVHLDRLDRGEAPTVAIPAPVQAIRFGDDLAWVFLPGEVVVDYATRLERELDGGRLWIHAYANACPGYVPSERILREGGYEGGGATIYYDIPGPFLPGLEDLLVAAVRRCTGEAFAARHDVSRTGGVRPLSAREALAAFRVAPGFRVELVAAEPSIASPVAVAFGPDGRAWVAEMADYPEGMPDGRPGGRVRCLHDDDGDGLPDRSSLFLEGIPFPTGVTPWRDGVLVCAAPDILLARDTDGDGRADRIETLFSGFATHNFQARVNGLEYGLDGWVEGSCGLFGGDITAANGTVTALGARDFRIDPDRGVLEPAAGCSQQGRVRDDAGHVFGCTNGAFALHFPLPDTWLRRSPFVAPRRSAVAIASEPGPGRLFPVSRQVLFELSGPAGRATAACGVAVYRDDLLAADGRPFTGDLFTCEPVNNLVHHQRLVPAGSTFSGTRVPTEAEREFLASTDAWFRPVQARTAPDGSLWVVDMARYVIEHPVWIPAESRAALDVRAGADRGRIWRVVALGPDGAPRRRPVPRIDRLSGEELASAIETPNGTVRDLVQRSIVWRDDRDARGTLRRLARESALDVTRLQSLCTLAELEALPADLLGAALADPSAAVRRQAVRLATIDAPGHGTVEGAIAAAIERLGDDPDAGVRLQVAAGTARLDPATAARVLLRLAEDPRADDILVAAAESALGEASAAAVIDLAGERPADRERPQAFEAIFVAAARRADHDALPRVLARARRRAEEAPTAATLGSLAGLVAVARERSDVAIRPSEWEAILDRAEALFRTADGDPDRLEDARAAAALLGSARFLGRSRAGALAAALDATRGPALRDGALAALAADGGPGVAAALLERVADLAPSARQGAIALLLERAEWAEALLAAIQEGRVPRGDVDLAARRTLVEHPVERVRSLAVAVWDETQGDRAPLVARYVDALGSSADAARGSDLFARHCAPCHRVDDRGMEVGPDIAGFAAKPAAALVAAILDPHRAVDPRYQTFVVELADGRSLAGMIVDETAASLVVLSAGAKRDTVRRAEIESLRGTGRSLMPEGFDAVLTPADVADLWAWLSLRQPAPKTLPGNTPATVAVTETAPAVLAAAAAAIHGGDIAFEQEHANVGMWHGADDTVRFAIDVAAPRTVDVWAEWACDPASAGNRLRIEGLEPAIVADVASTGAWSRYALVRLGQASLDAGSGEIVVRADGIVRGALVDLRALHLVPPGAMPEAVGRVASSTAPDNDDAPFADAPVERLAATLLDGSLPENVRGRMVAGLVADATPPDRAAAVLRAMADGLPAPSGSAEEYARIPAIWRLAVAVGQRANPEMTRAVIAAALPDADAGLAHWQAVVLGGGIVNGAGLDGRWPGRAVAEAIGADAALGGAWRRALDEAVAMADDPSVPDGTRYDALRMAALRDPPAAVGHLARFLAGGVSAELEQGAVSGMADIDHPDATAALVGALPRLAGANRDFAVRGLVRDERRCLSILAAIAAGTVPADLRRHEAILPLREHASAAVRAEARRVLGE